MTAIRITVTATAEDFKSANRLIYETLKDRIDTMSDSTGSSMVEVVEVDTANGRIIDGYNYSQCARGEVSI